MAASAARIANEPLQTILQGLQNLYASIRFRPAPPCLTTPRVEPPSLEKACPWRKYRSYSGTKALKATERHYAKWVKGRQDRLDKLVTATC